MKKIKYLTLILIIYSTGVGAQDWTYTPFATSTPYPTKMKILKIGTVDMSLPENECPAKNWSFYGGDNDIPWFEYKSVRYNKGMMVTWVVGGWTMQELKAIEDSANGITYSFQIKTWYDTVKPKVENDTIYTEVPLVKPYPKKQPIDSSKYFYRRFLKLKSQGVEDSCNPYKQKILNYKNKK